jgi:hypothetical protein
MNWSVDYARERFIDFSAQSFSHRKLFRVPGFKNVAQFFCSFRYKTEGIESALQDAFGEGPMFGVSRDGKDQVKVGVVAATGDSQKPYLFSNYSRNPTTGKTHSQQDSTSILNFKQRRPIKARR